jgi:hypothetical protein
MGVIFLLDAFSCSTSCSMAAWLDDVCISILKVLRTPPGTAGTQCRHLHKYIEVNHKYMLLWPSSQGTQPLHIVEMIRH